MKMECDYLNGWIKNGHIRKDRIQNGEPQRYGWRTQKKKKKKSQAPEIPWQEMNLDHSTRIHYRQNGPHGGMKTKKKKKKKSNKTEIIKLGNPQYNQNLHISWFQKQKTQSQQVKCNHFLTYTWPKTGF